MLTLATLCLQLSSAQNSSIHSYHSCYSTLHTYLIILSILITFKQFHLFDVCIWMVLLINQIEPPSCVNNLQSCSARPYPSVTTPKPHRHDETNSITSLRSVSLFTLIAFLTFLGAYLHDGAFLHSHRFFNWAVPRGIYLLYRITES